MNNEFWKNHKGKICSAMAAIASVGILIGSKFYCASLPTPARDICLAASEALAHEVAAAPSPAVVDGGSP